MDTSLTRRAVLAGVAGTCLGLARRAEAQVPSTAELAADLAALREEEKLARDVYLALGRRWPLPAFAHIARAEQRHFEQVGLLLAARGVPDPAREAEGAFSEARFTALHDALIARGMRSEVAALQVGAEIEELDLADLEAMQARTADPDALRVYERLACGSRNHLRAFDALLTARGLVYAPTHLPVARYREIAASPHERCGAGPGGGGGRRGGGRGRGMGRGRGGPPPGTR